MYIIKIFTIENLKSNLDEYLFCNVSKSDGKKLVSWWNANTPYLHFLEREKYGGKYVYHVRRQITNKNN